MANKKVFFESVRALPDYRLEVEMGTGSCIVFDFNTRLSTLRFGALKEINLFNSVYTDGSYLVFETPDYRGIRITAKEFMDMVLVDPTLDS